MEYHKEDGWLFGPENTSNHAEGWTMVCWLVCLILLSLILGCDGQDAQAHQESIQTASLKKEALMGMPCTWVAVCIHEPCSVLHRKCVDADLTERK